MPRLSPIRKTDAPPEALPFYELDEQRYGEVLHNTELYAYNIAVLRAVKGFVAAFAEADTIPLALKSVIRVRVATLNLCPF